jgi:4-hydroxy-tetrahydrodipicolinate synthase
MTLPGRLWVALATPFSAAGALDLDAFARLVRHVRAGGTDVLVALGSTGEAATLTDGERDAVIRAAVTAAAGAPVVVGTGASSTAQTAAWTSRAQELGAQGAMVVVPPYVRPTQQGIVAHFAAIARAAPRLPLVAYNVPGRTGTNLEPATVQRLWALPEVAALKESSGDLQQIEAIARALPPGRLLLAGDDALAVASIQRGARGLVSVFGNLLPDRARELVGMALAGEDDRALALHEHLLPVLSALAAEPNPIPLKAALAGLGFGSEHVRLPLLPAQPATRQRLTSALAAFGACR